MAMRSKRTWCIPARRGGGPSAAMAAALWLTLAAVSGCQSAGTVSGDGPLAAKAVVQASAGNSEGNDRGTPTRANASVVPAALGEPYIVSAGGEHQLLREGTHDPSDVVGGAVQQAGFASRVGGEPA